MPITKSGEDNAPAWCGMSYVEVVMLSRGEGRTFARRGLREKMIVGAGSCAIRFDDQAVEGDVKQDANKRPAS